MSYKDTLQFCWSFWHSPLNETPSCLDSETCIFNRTFMLKKEIFEHPFHSISVETQLVDQLESTTAREWQNFFLEKRTETNIFNVHDNVFQGAIRCLTSLYSTKKTHIPQNDARRLWRTIKRLLLLCTEELLGCSFARGTGLSFFEKPISCYFEKNEFPTSCSTKLSTELDIPSSEMIVAHGDPLLEEEVVEPIAIALQTYFVENTNDRYKKFRWIGLKPSSSLTEVSLELLDLLVAESTIQNFYASAMTDLGLGEVSPEIPIELVSFFKQQIVSFYEQVFSTAMSSRSF